MPYTKCDFNNSSLISNNVSDIADKAIGEVNNNKEPLVVDYNKDWLTEPSGRPKTRMIQIYIPYRTQ